MAKEGTLRSNIADELIKLNRFDDARTELRRAIECDAPYGHAAEPWKTFDILTNLERAVGNSAAATQARQQAIDAFLSYRRDGGENHNSGGRLALLISQAIQSGETAAAAQQLAELQQQTDLHDYLKTLIPALLQILNDSRDPTLAADPDLYYTDAAELTLLLEQL